MITREFNLNLNAGRSTPLVIFANQFNSDEQWVFTLFDDSGQQYIPSSGSIVGIKADGLGIINSATVTAGKVVVDVTEQITSCAGISEFELSLDNGTHGTANFKVVVEKKPSEGAEYSDSDISLIQEALNIVNPLPTGGTAGQVLTKTTNGSSWQDAQAGLPSGGTTGQVLTKTASGSAWQNAEKELPTGGSAGQVLTKTASGTTWSSVDAFPSEGTTGQVLTKATDGVAWTDAGNPTDTQVATAVSDWLDENITPTTPAVDATLTITGAAADAKKTGDEISALKSQIAQSSGLTDTVKNALLQIARKVAYIDEDGQDYYDALYSAFYTVEVVSISAVFDNGGEYIFDTASLDDLKQYLTVTASYDNGTSGEVTGYTLSGSMVAGIQEITVSFSGKTATFNVTVYHNYANQSFTDWAAGTGVTKTASQITLKSTQANANSWKIWTADKSNTWGSLKNKHLKARLTLYSPDWVGEQSDTAPLNKCSYEVAVYSGTGQTSLNDRVVHYQYGVNGVFVPATEPTVYDIDFTATTDVSVTDAYRIGINLYNASANTVIITKAELIEVFEESET